MKKSSKGIKRVSIDGGDTYLNLLRSLGYTDQVISSLLSFIKEKGLSIGKDPIFWALDGTIIGFQGSEQDTFAKMKSNKEFSD